MNNEERLYQAIGEVDDELLERMERAMAEQPTGRADRNRNKGRLLWQAALSSVLIAAAALLLIFNDSLFHRDGNVTYTASGPVVDRAIGNESSSSVVTPGNGQIVYFDSVRRAFETNKDSRTKYFVAIDLFADEMPLNVGSFDTHRELKRLQELGLQVGYAESWTYQGEGGQVDYLYAAGLLTAEQLKNFPASSEYGYAFRFATNADGTPVTTENFVEAGSRTKIK